MPEARETKSAMKSKTFQADEPAAIIQAVNDWLSGETGIAIRDTETTPADPATGKKLQFCIWYDQDAP
jgi:hypothetical protein